MVENKFLLFISRSPGLRSLLWQPELFTHFQMADGPSFLSLLCLLPQKRVECPSVRWRSPHRCGLVSGQRLTADVNLFNLFGASVNLWANSASFASRAIPLHTAMILQSLSAFLSWQATPLLPLGTALQTSAQFPGASYSFSSWTEPPHCPLGSPGMWRPYVLHVQQSPHLCLWFCKDFFCYCWFS